MRAALLKYGAAVLMAVAVPAAFGQSGQPNQSGQSDRSNRSDQSNPSSQERSDRSGQSNERSESHQRADRSGTQAPDGYLFLEEQTVYLMANEPQQHFLQAHADFARNDLRAAAEETRMAAAYLDMQAARDRNNNGQQDQQDLKNEANQLRQISHQLEQQHRQGQQNQQGQPNQQAQQNEQKGNQSELSLQHLDRAFAKASEALAKHFDALTKSELSKQRYIAAGYDLNATANCFKNTIVWSDAKPSKDDMTMIANAQEVAANLRDSEVYQGQQALKQEQKQLKDESSKNNSNSASNTAQNQPGQERQAAAHLPAGVTNNPLTGTTPAEARNDAEHANKIADALGQAIDQYGNKIRSDNPSSGSSAGNQTGSNYDHNQSHNQKEQSQGSQQQNQNQPKNQNR